MIDYYLRAPDADAMRSALGSLPSEGVTIDELGVMYRVINDETGEAEEIPGYFANVRSDFPLEFVGVDVVYPVTPWRVFA